MTRLRERRGRRSATAFVVLDRSRCEACWECLEVCPQAVLGKVDFLGHRHAKVKTAEDCMGCGRCVKVCGAGALTRRNARESGLSQAEILTPDAEAPTRTVHAKQPVLS
jgi:NAD-dependent dihydropyrimidine dehydrogenase PreA subunit